MSAEVLGSKAERKQFYKTLLWLVLPMAMQDLINVGVTSADVIMLGSVSETVLSASSLAGQIQFVMTLIFFGLTSGGAVLTAQYWGKGDTQTIESVVGIVMRFSIVVGIVFCTAVVAFPDFMMRIFTNEQPVIDEGVKYLRIIGFSYLFTSVTMVYLNLMKSVEKVVVSAVIYLCSFIINLILGIVLIFGLLGFPKLGIQGAAIGTLIARIIEFMIAMIYSRKKSNPIHPHIRAIFVHNKLLFRDFLRFSIPVTINELMWGTGVALNSVILGHLGSAAVAANSVTQVVRQLSMVLAFGLAGATAIMLGKAIGADLIEKAELYAKRFVRLCLITGVLGSVVVLIAGPVALSFMNLSGEARGYLSVMIIVMSYFVIGQSYNTTMIVGIFRGGGDTKYGLFVDVSTMWGGSLLFGALSAFVFHLSVPWVYVVIMSDEILKIPLTTWRYKSKIWLRNVTRNFGEEPE